MLFESKFSKHYWGDAMYTMMYVHNLTPTLALNSEISNKTWFGKNAYYDHLRVFGCKDFVHVLKDEISKLHANSKQCIFIGYGLDEFGYMLCDPIIKNLITSHDAMFIEYLTIEDNDKVKKGTTAEKYNIVSDVDPIRLPNPNTGTIDGNIHNDEPHNYIDDKHI